jgi:hypothetical protein
MKVVRFYNSTSGEFIEVGQVRLVHGKLVFSDENLKKFLIQNAVVYGGKPNWPSNTNPKRYIKLLPFGFLGSYFWASKVSEEKTT